MIDLRELLQSHKGGGMTKFCELAGVHAHSGRQAVQGYDVRVDTAIKLLKQLGHKPPCEVGEAGDYVRALWAKNPENNTVRTGERLGIHYTTVNNWLRGHTCNPNYTNFLMLCKYLSDSDHDIHNYKFGGF
jgi:hypothetical protein